MALPPRRADAAALAECADEIIERIEAAAAPVVVVDVEIRRYGVEDKIAALARKLNLPLVTAVATVPSASELQEADRTRSA